MSSIISTEICTQQTPLLVQYCIITSTFTSCLDRKRVFIRYLIAPREFAKWANTRVFVGPFTTSCGTQTRILSKSLADTVTGGSMIYCECDRVKNEEVRRRAGIKMELASRVDQRVLWWFGHVERMDDYRMARRVLMAEVSGGRVRGRARLGWMDGVNVALGNRGMTVEAARQ